MYIDFQHMLKQLYLMKPVELERAAEQAVRRTLSEVPSLSIGPTKPGGLTADAGFDFALPVNTNGGRFRLLCEVKSSGQPRIARAASLQLLRYARPKSGDYAVFIAPFVSPQAAQICTREGVGYLDLAGNCRLAFGRVYIQKDQYPNPFVHRRDLRSLYSPKAERVLRVLLANPKKSWKTQALADAAQVSLGQVANVKKLLGDREWIQTELAGFRLSDPGVLLTEWGANYRSSRNAVNDFYSLKDTAQAETEIAKTCDKLAVTYGFSGFSGAARLAPAVRYQRVTVYVADGLDALVEDLGLKPVSSGANVSLLAPYDAGVFYASRRIGAATIVSPIQVYLDLLTMKGRGEEAATAILEEVIKPTWQ
jgi:hypothetical protein